MEGTKKPSDLLEKFGLSRLLRYTYAGCLLIIFVYLFTDFDLTKLTTIPAPIIFLFTIAIGAAVYAFHRSIGTLISHLLLCGVLRILERLPKIQKCSPEKYCSFTRWLGQILHVQRFLDKYAYEIIIQGCPPNESCSPTRWLGKALGVPKFKRIYAYDIIRGSEVFNEDERETMNIAHAESHLIIMTSLGFFLVALYRFFNFHPSFKTSHLCIIGVALWIASLPRAIELHSIECLKMRAREDKVRKVLEDTGIIKANNSSTRSDSTVKVVSSSR